MRNIYVNMKFRERKHDMSCAQENIIMAELNRHTSEHVNVINIFHDLNSHLYTVTNRHSKVGFSVVQN